MSECWQCAQAKVGGTTCEIHKQDDSSGVLDTAVCPFCGEGYFDLIGLKVHLVRGWCDKFNEINENGGKQ